jgi:pimeloyl-ACP methyl ester carboxylesterase
MSELDERRVRLSDAEFTVLDEGDAEDPAVVLLHGVPGSNHVWRNLGPLLAPSLRVIAPELTRPPGEPADIGLAAQAARVRELLGALGVSRFAAVGHGVGGGVAQLLALDHGAEALVLLDPAAFDRWPGAWVSQARERLALGERTAADLVEDALRLSVVQEGRLTAEDVAAYRRPYEGPEGDAALRRLLEALDGIGLEGRDADLERLETPTLVLWGEEDAFHPAELAERFADILQMGSVAVLPGCGHHVLDDAPETVAPLIFEFLRSRYLSAPHAHGGGPVPLQLGRRPPGREEA